MSVNWICSFTLTETRLHIEEESWAVTLGEQEHFKGFMWFNVSESEDVSVCASYSWGRLRSTWPLSTVITRQPTSCWEPASAETPAPKWTEPRCTWLLPRDTQSSWSCWSGSEPLSALLQLNLVFEPFNSVKIRQGFYLLTWNVSRSWFVSLSSGFFDFEMFLFPSCFLPTCDLNICYFNEKSEIISSSLLQCVVVHVRVLPPPQNSSRLF